MQQFLAAFDGEGGDDEIAAALERVVDLGLEGLAALVERVVGPLAAAIGGFGEDVVKS